jgi:hypothetical protein
MTEWKDRLCAQLEPVLRNTDPRPAISSYHDMPYAVFQYPPEDEFAVRQEIALLQTRLEQQGKRITIISLADCLKEALVAADMPPKELVEAERNVGLDLAVDTVHEVLSDFQPLDDLVAGRIPSDADPLRDIVFIVRAGSLFPFYRTSSLLEQIKGKVHVPAVLFYPGEMDGVAGLRFMGVLDAEHNYRPKIF